MKRLFALLGLALGLALAQAPAYPENTLGLGYAPDRGFYLQGSALLPFSPLGLDTGLDAQVLLSQSPEAYALLKANLFPGLVVEGLFASVGLGLDLRYPFGAHLGPLASLELPGGALSLGLGLGYQAGAGLHLAWGAGFRLYLEPLAAGFPPRTATPSSSPSSTSGSPCGRSFPSSSSPCRPSFPSSSSSSTPSWRWSGSPPGTGRGFPSPGPWGSRTTRPSSRTPPSGKASS